MLMQYKRPSEVAIQAADDAVSTAEVVISPLGGFHELIPRPVTRSTSVMLFGVMWTMASMPGRATFAISIVRAVREMPGSSPGEISVKEASERARRNVAVLVDVTRYVWLLW